MIEMYTSSVRHELEYYSGMAGERQLMSIYLGGGTPSFLSPGQLEDILSVVSNCFHIESNCEITMEVNPEDVVPGYSQTLKTLGVTRISLGVQSFQDSVLQAVRRNHTSEMARKALSELKGFQHGVSMDLILGLPNQSLGTIESDLNELGRFETEHLSLYLLERDLPVPLDKYQQIIPTEDDQADFYECVCFNLQTLGYDHYEISNFCKPGFASRHNLNYWLSGDYIGVGPAAHGRNGKTYWQNHPRVIDYCEAVKAFGHGRSNLETWDETRFESQRKIQAMRLLKGLHDENLTRVERAQFQDLMESGLLHRENETWKLTPKGLLLANEVFSVFI